MKKGQTAKSEKERVQIPEADQFVRPNVTLTMAQKLKRIFVRLDSDKKGLVDLARVRAMVGGLKQEQKFKRCLRLLDEAITSSEAEQRVDFFKFMQIFGMDSQLPPDQVFGLIEQEAKGPVTQQALRTVAKRVNLSYSQKELQAMLESVDQDKDGAISKSEFITFMNKKRKLE